jgi:nucleotide-binding universal stress UspA family protein
MRWMIGLDMAGLSSGAVAAARSMAKRAPKDVFLGVHVLEHVQVQPPFTRNVDDLIDRALGPVREEAFFADIGTLPASAAEDGLVAALSEKQCDALIVGRRSSDPTSIVRLGRVARNVLRLLPKPVLVVPPDATTISDGPVLLATDLAEASEGAARFAPKLAERLDLDLLVTHVTRIPGSIRAVMPSEQWSNVVGRAEEAARERFAPWLERHGLGDARHSIVHGSPAAKILEVAKVSGASILVVGSRGLSNFDRLFLSSMASELAAAAPIPVAVVPNDWS